MNPNSRTLQLCTILDTNKNHCFNAGNMPTNKFTNVQIRQNWDRTNNDFRLVIAIDGKIRQTTVNSKPQLFRDVTLWAADPSHVQADAVVKNLVFKNLPHGKSSRFLFNAQEF